MAYQPRLLTLDSCGPAGLAKVLAWEPSRNDVYWGELRDLANIWQERHTGKVLLQYARRGRFDLAQQLGLMSRQVKAELDTPDPCEEPRNPKVAAVRSTCRTPLPFCHEWMLPFARRQRYHQPAGPCTKPGESKGHGGGRSRQAIKRKTRPASPPAPRPGRERKGSRSRPQPVLRT